MRVRGIKSLQQKPVQRKDLRKVFEQLDKDRSGTLCLEELYEPLLSLGLIEKKQEVQELIEHIGSKNSGIIEFHEFLRAFDSTRAKKHNKIDILLRDMESNIILNQKTDLPFNLCIMSQRRNIMMSAYLGETLHDREKGMKILKAYANTLEDTGDTPTKLQRIIMRRSSDYAKINSRISNYKFRFENAVNASKTSRFSRILPFQKLTPMNSTSRLLL